MRVYTRHPQGKDQRIWWADRAAPVGPKTHRALQQTRDTGEATWP